MSPWQVKNLDRWRGVWGWVCNRPRPPVVFVWHDRQQFCFYWNSKKKIPGWGSLFFPYWSPLKKILEKILEILQKLLLF